MPLVYCLDIWWISWNLSLLGRGPGAYLAPGHLQLSCWIRPEIAPPQCAWRKWYKQLCEIENVCIVEIQVAQNYALVGDNVRVIDEWRPRQSAPEESSMRAPVLNHYYNMVIKMISEISNISRAFKRNSALKHMCQTITIISISKNNSQWWHVVS